MYAQFTYLDGSRTGQVRAAAKDYATIGRHPECDIQFGPDSELEVSVQHAAVFKQGGDFMIRDLGSTNGTFLGGKRVRGDRPLTGGDILQFGATGPKLEFSLSDALPVTIRPDPPAVPVRVPRAEIFGPKTRPTERLRMEAPPEPSNGWKWVVAGLLIVAAGTAIGFKLRDDHRRSEAAARQRVLMARLQESKARLDLLKTSSAGVQTRLEEARQSIDALGATIMNTTIAPGQEVGFGERIAADSALHQVIIDAAGFDPAAAIGASGPAVAAVVAEFADGVRAGSGIAVRSGGDTVLVVTAGALVADPTGPLRTLVVIFNGHSTSHRATILRGAGQPVVLLRIEVHGGNPVAAIGETPAPGRPVAVAGFPSSLDSLGDWRKTGVRSRVATGSIGAGLALLTYGFPVSLGTPIFSARGELVGLVTGPGPTATAGTAIRPLLTP